MKHKCFISFKSQDMYYKKYIQNKLDVDMVDKSLNEPINSENPDYIMNVIRRDYLKDSTVTIHLIGEYSAENSLGQNQYFIKKELQGSLYNGEGNTKNGILGVVLPSVTDQIFRGTYKCAQCGNTHNFVDVESHTVKEFSYNYYIPNSKCAWGPDDHYYVLVKWRDFLLDPNKYIDMAFEKRSAPIANKTKVRPK